MGRMFNYASSLTSLDLSGWDTGNVTHMSQMFEGATGLVAIEGLSGWDLGSTTHLHRMFAGASSLVSLDLSGWDTGTVTNMGSMFIGTSALRQLALGANFSFIGSPALPEPPNTAEFTGHWQNVGSGTVTAPNGVHVLTSAQLMATFNGAAMADTWVWQRTPFWGIGLTPPGNHNFPPASAGYGLQTHHTITVNNIGNQATGALTIALSGPNSGDFTLSAATLASLALNGSAAFTVAPNVGLPVGLHTATVTVSGGNGISESFVVSFTVEPASATPNPPSGNSPGGSNPSGGGVSDGGDDNRQSGGRQNAPSNSGGIVGARPDGLPSYTHVPPMGGAPLLPPATDAPPTSTAQDASPTPAAQAPDPTSAPAMPEAQAEAAEVVPIAIPPVATQVTGSWALLNLVLSVAGAVSAAAVMAHFWAMDKKSANPETPDPENRKRRKRWLAAMGVVSLVGLALFSLTQNMNNQMVMFNVWTPAHAVLIAAQGAAIWRVLAGGKEMSAPHCESV